MYSKVSVNQKDTKSRSFYTVIIVKCLLSVESKIKVNRDICKMLLNTIALSKALKYGNTQCYLQTSHIYLYSPAAEHRRPLAGTHFTVPQRVEGCVDLSGWLHTKIKCRLRESNPDMVTHPSTNRAQRRLTSLN